ncbi:MAG: recombinase family protein [Roseburia sp.]
MARTAKRYRENLEQMWGASQKRYAVGIYSRLSVDQGDRKSESIENQIVMIRQYIDNFNRIWEGKEELAVYDTYIDRGISGTSFQRPAFARLMEDVRNHRVDCIIVKDLSRFGRDYLEAGSYIEKILPFLGVRFIAVTDGFDSQSEHVAEQKLEMNLKNLVNDMYAKDISMKVSLARKLSAQGGGYIGGAAPYGYTVLKAGGVRKLEIHPENAKIVQFLFESYAEGISCQEIIVALYEKKVHRSSDFYKYGHTYWREGERLHQWSGAVIRGILANPVYSGKLEQGKRTSFLIAMEHTHEAIVAPELFEKVRLMREEGKKRSCVEAECREDENIFRNLLFCAGCGGKMHATFYQGRVNGRRKYAYYCRRAYYMDARKCERNYITEEQLSEYVKEQIRTLLQRENLTGRKLAALNQEVQEKRKKVYRGEICCLQKRQERLLVQAANIYMKYREGSVGQQEYLAFRESKNEFGSFCKKRMEELDRRTAHCERQAKKENCFLRALRRAGNKKRLNRELVEALIEKIVVSASGGIDIYFLTGSVGK